MNDGNIFQQLIAATFPIAGYQMHWLELIGILIGAASAYLGMKRWVWAWPVGIVANIMLFFVYLGAIFGADQRIPLFAATGFDAWALVLAQAKTLREAKGPIFPYNSKSVGTAFRRACNEVGVKDLHFHDLRHDGTSRLFEMGLAIEQVALVTGHKDWKMLRRYTHIRPESLHRLVAARAPYPVEKFAAE